MLTRGSIAALGSALVAGLLQWGLWGVELPLVLLIVAAVTSLVVTGVTLADDPEQRRTGVDMVLAAAFFVISWWPNWPPEAHVGLFPLFGKIFGYLWFVFAARAVLRYPDARTERRSERLLVRLLIGWIVGGKVLLTVVSVPGWHGYSGGLWWPPVFVDRRAFDAAQTVFDAGIALLAAGIVLVLALKLVRSRGLDRLDAVPVLTASIATGACGVTYLVIQLVSPGHDSLAVLRVVTTMAVLSISLGFLATVIGRRLARVGVVRMIEQLQGRTAPSDVQQALRRVLRDPELTVRLDPDAAACDCDRWSHRVESTDGVPVAVVCLDPALRRYRGLTLSALAAARQALEIDRLHTERLAELRTSRERVLQAALSERERIERDLHDGVQQTLLAAAARLAAVDVAPQMLDGARADLRLAMRQLRDLARGIYPRELTEHGLAAALPGLAERCGVPVQVRVADVRLPHQVEVTLYFVASEALTNMDKHAAARSACLEVAVRDGAARLRVSDDGEGGARATTEGSGLAGMRGRVQAVGGSFSTDSRPGSGTVVEAWVPCGSR